AVCPAQDAMRPFWDTGNHATAGMVGEQLTVSKQDARPGSTGTKSAYMASIKAAIMGMGKLAAGNLFVGRFVRVVGTGGIVEFGRDFDFTARPKAIRFWIKNNQGQINEGSHTSGTDLAKVYCCFTDRKFTVNTNEESTLFTPSIETEGILASAYWESTESRSEWTQIEIDLQYRENLTTKPTTLVLTFTCSGYGDYFTGSTNSYMYVDDVEFVY
ncbi:MAG: PCMD domain-containing protein, partial [Alistipes sp.]|nr:PCMD domain-containing protein [Alistipes sp.]